MRYTEQEARQLIVRAGHRLVESGLVARTWGNISARISDTHFVITPSGLAYETLTPELLVTVRIDDCTYEGSRKPSSEKGIHAAAYRHRPQVGFVIHTHQDYASCIGVAGSPLTGPEHPLLGSCVPCAAYGLPGTKKLRQGVEAAITAHPEASAFFMRQHGALCLAADFEQAFAVAQALEALCRERLEQAVTWPQEAAVTMALPEIEGCHVCLETHPAVQALAAKGKTLKPHLDDLAQIAGASIRCADPDSAAIAKAMQGRNAVLVPGVGAVCAAADKDDLGAIAAILRKSAMAALYAEVCGAKPLSGFDRQLMRTVYTMKYAAKKKEA